MSTGKWYRDVLHAASLEGVWDARIQQGSKHPRLLCAMQDGRNFAVTIAQSPSDHRALRNVRRIVRRYVRNQKS